MDEKDILNPEKGGAFFGIIITEAILVLIILITLFTAKYFFKGTFEKIKDWYEINICADTDTNEVIYTAGGGLDEV